MSAHINTRLRLRDPLRTAHLCASQNAGYPCDPQLSRTSNSPLWAFITVKDLLAASGQILVATNTQPRRPQLPPPRPPRTLRPTPSNHRQP